MREIHMCHTGGVVSRTGRYEGTPLGYIPYRKDLALKYGVCNEHYIITVQSQRELLALSNFHQTYRYHCIWKPAFACRVYPEVHFLFALTDA